jgi:hypothetical protein
MWGIGTVELLLILAAVIFFVLWNTVGPPRR